MITWVAPSARAMRSPSNIPSYSAILLVVLKLSLAEYIAFCPDGDTITAPAPGPHAKYAPSGYIVQTLLDFSGVHTACGVYSATKSATTCDLIVVLVVNKMSKGDSLTTHFPILPVESLLWSISPSRYEVGTITLCAKK
ncbi:hypothetical protein GUJ93_ZPchr0009g1905 [Zizania palustris]|uniref:Uncharacterized protein n=1 Tax=Zizania palustris TaxID=103762 RepID=A0A8J5VL05_ZIZPA|nr:hypothetical protein GUJ93_ZPchr0009g1905 [Zizania palustris]